MPCLPVRVLAVPLLCAALVGGEADGQADPTDASASTLPAPYVPPADNQLMTLGGSKGDRFKLTEITWPADPGQAEVCLWQDDKYAAVSVTIDDNCAPDHQWWLDICAKYDIRVTWFVVTGGVDGKNKGFNGTWADFAKLLAAGHDVQSHTISHRKSGDTDPEEQTRKEYAGSIQTIEEKLPGHRCVAMAYPWGKGKSDLARDYYIAVRGVSGIPSKANRINYLGTGKGDASEDCIHAILGEPVTKTKWLGDKAFRRGWIQPLYHYVHAGHNPEEKKATAERAAADIARLAEHKDRIWIDTFVAVAKYGQERDSATLTTTASTSERIELGLVDRMRDDVFDAPLTIKVRLPDAWTTVVASQGGTAIAASLVQHEGKPYALVGAVPDRGAVVITAQ